VTLDDVFNELTEAQKHAETAKELAEDGSFIESEVDMAVEWTRQAREWVAEELSDTSTEAAREERAVWEHDGSRLAVCVDGDWLPEMMLYTDDLAIFRATDGTEVDVRADRDAILFEAPTGETEEIDPSSESERAVTVYTPPESFSADCITVVDLTEELKDDA